MDVIDLHGKPCLMVEVYSRKWNGVEFVDFSEETKVNDKALMLSLPELKMGKDNER